jgi:glutamine amidotransferase
MRVAIIDYGLGNLFSVSQAVKAVGAGPYLVSKPDDILSAEHLILPGVGAFADGMRGLQEKKLDQAIIEYAHSHRPLLGICLGMQLLFDRSREFGDHVGLGLIPGEVNAIPRQTKDAQTLRVPHIGWNAIQPKDQSWQKTILQGTRPGQSFYFVHSYVCSPTQTQHILAECEYGGHSLTAVVKKDRIQGCQFHPEKSGENGLNLIRQFLGGASYENS